MSDDPGRGGSARVLVVAIVVVGVALLAVFAVVPLVFTAVNGNPAGLLLFGGLFALAVVVARLRYPGLWRTPGDRRRRR
ncbi:hypothetical protein [Herbiconiux sp. A18JL235]|uniref:Uncharacterized protein n=1 Tax=Herbiconiux sp. A18JL235 TaxID=3152363 RepID=A0AB39BJ80_9MICO